MRILLAFTLFTALAWSEPKKETGEINGARFRIDVPEKWNGGLVMYCHGYSPVPGNFDNPKPNPVKIPSDFVMNPALNATVEKLLDSKPAQSATLRRWTGLRDNKEMAGTL